MNIMNFNVYLDVKYYLFWMCSSVIVSLTPVHGGVYSIQHCVIKFVRDLRHVGGFLWVLRVLWFSLPVKLTATK